LVIYFEWEPCYKDINAAVTHSALVKSIGLILFPWSSLSNWSSKNGRKTVRVYFMCVCGNPPVVGACDHWYILVDSG